jgi:hypothetical protein
LIANQFAEKAQKLQASEGFLKDLQFEYNSFHNQLHESKSKVKVSSDSITSAVKSEVDKSKARNNGHFQPTEGKIRHIFDIWFELFQFYIDEYPAILNFAKFYLTISLNKH